MRKGFTLIELLAVIIVLAVIALIATPIVLDVIDSAKLKAFEESAYGIIETVKLKNYDGILDGSNDNKTYTFPNDELVFQGERPKGGSAVSVNGDIVIAIHNDKYCATKKLGDEKVTITENLENCDIKYVSLNGTITETDPIVAKVELIKNGNVIYETTSDEAGNYVFNDIVADSYLVLVSQPSKTKYGREVDLIDDNNTYDMNVTMHAGDIDGNDIINENDINMVNNCYLTAVSERPECKKADIDNSGIVRIDDLSLIKANYQKISDVKLNGGLNISGKVDNEYTNELTVTLVKNGTKMYTTTLESDKTFKLADINKESYLMKIEKRGYLAYKKYVLFNKDVNDINISLIAGDLNNDGIIDENDVVSMNETIEEGWLPDSILKKKYDLNDDGVIDSQDLAIVQANIGKSYN